MACPLGSFLKVKLRRIPLIPSHAPGQQKMLWVRKEPKATGRWRDRHRLTPCVLWS